MKQFLIAALSLTLAMPAMAQQVSPSQLQAQLNQAMCAQNWSSAIANIDALIGVGLDSASTQNLTTLRSQVAEIQSSGQTFASMPGWNCGGSSLNWDRAAGAVTTRSGASSGVRARPEPQVQGGWRTAVSPGEDEYLETYSYLNQIALAGRDVLNDGYLYCNLRERMTESELLNWRLAQQEGLNAQEANRVSSHWIAVKIGASDHLCP